MTDPAAPTPPSPAAPKSNKKMFMLVGGGAGVAAIALFCVCSGIIGGYLLLHGSGSGSSLIGKWKADDGSGTLEFKSDNTFVIEVGGNSATGTYKVDGNKFTSTITNNGQPHTYTDQFDISGNTLTLTENDNGATATHKYTRM